MDTKGQCDLDQQPTEQGRTLCPEHEQAYLKELMALLAYLPVIREIAYKQAKPGPRAHGGGKYRNPADPINERAFQLLDDIDSYAVSLVGECWGLHVNPVQSVLLILRTPDRVLTGQAESDDYMQCHELYARTIHTVTPPPELTIIGQCPQCGTQMAVMQGAEKCLCPMCGTLSKVTDIIAMRRRKLFNVTFAGSPRQAARKLRTLGIPCTGSQISNLSNKGRLPHARKLRRGVWSWNLGEIVEKMDDPHMG